MALLKLASRSIRNIALSSRYASVPIHRNFAGDRQHENTPSWRETQNEKPTGPHIKHTTSTISNDLPSVGADKAPPELLTSVDPNFTLGDSNPENSNQRTDEALNDAAADENTSELGLGEMEGAKFKVEPLRRIGEDGNTLRARLLCPLLLTVTSPPFPEYHSKLTGIFTLF